MEKTLKKLGFTKLRDESSRPSEQIYYELRILNSILVGLKISIRPKIPEIYIQCQVTGDKPELYKEINIVDPIPYSKKAIKKIVKKLSKLSDGNICKIALFNVENIDKSSTVNYNPACAGHPKQEYIHHVSFKYK